MKDSAPILSICIPTFNRSAWLEKTLISIASQAAFYDGEEIEIVISDNQSDDDTQRISEEYSLRFPGKVRYYRNSDQIGAMNFEQALFRGRGDFLKLHNDTLLCVDGCLSEILNIIKATQDEKPVIFFLNSRVEGCESITVCPSLNDFLAHASFMCTWIGAFGIWKTDFQAVGDFSKDLALNSIDMLLPVR